jgi:hypothetical protein
MGVKTNQGNQRASGRSFNMASDAFEGVYCVFCCCLGFQLDTYFAIDAAFALEDTYVTWFRKILLRVGLLLSFPSFPYGAHQGRPLNIEKRCVLHIVHGYSALAGL